jgi:hypothetical protein
MTTLIFIRALGMQVFCRRDQQYAIPPQTSGSPSASKSVVQCISDFVPIKMVAKSGWSWWRRLVAMDALLHMVCSVGPRTGCGMWHRGAVCCGGFGGGRLSWWCLVGTLQRKLCCAAIVVWAQWPIHGDVGANLLATRAPLRSIDLPPSPFVSRPSVTHGPHPRPAFSCLTGAAPLHVCPRWEMAIARSYQLCGGCRWSQIYLHVSLPTAC